MLLMSNIFRTTGILIAAVIVILVMFLLIRYGLVPYLKKRAKGFNVNGELRKLDKSKYKRIKKLYFENSRHKRFTENVIVSDYGVFIVNARFEIGSVSKYERGKFVLTKDGVNHVLGAYEQDNLAAFDKMKKLSNDFDGVKFYSIVAFPDSTEINVKSEIGIFGHLKDVVPYIKSVNKNPMRAEQRDAVYAALRSENSINHR